MSLADLAALWERHSTAITIGLVLAFAARVVLKGRANLRRFTEAQAQRRAAAASLGFKAPGTEPHHSVLDGVLATLVDGTERFGRFPLFEGSPRVKLQFEGERQGFRLAVFSHRESSEYADEPATTCAFFAAPEIDVPEFRLRPTGGPSDPEITFAERPRFGERYSLTSTFTVRIRDAFNAGALEFFEKNPGWTVEGANGRLLVYREDVEVKPEAIGDFVREAVAVAEVFR
jgi:hypothetical protein